MVYKERDKMRVVVEKDAIKPTKAHEFDAGWDLYSRDVKVVHAHSYETFDTGVHIEIPNGYVGFLKSKSGLNVKHNIVSEGVIDSGYTGSIVVKLYNHGDEDYQVLKGNKITQIVFLPILTDTMDLVDELGETDRGDNGFGSSGK